MRSLHRWFLVAALAVAGVWIHSLAGSAAMLLALLEGLDEAPDVARVGGDERPPGPEAPQGPGSQTLAAAAQSDHGVLPEQIPGGDLSAAQIAAAGGRSGVRHRSRGGRRASSRARRVARLAR